MFHHFMFSLFLAISWRNEIIRNHHGMIIQSESTEFQAQYLDVNQLQSVNLSISQHGSITLYIYGMLSILLHFILALNTKISDNI